MAKYIALSDVHLGQNKADQIKGGQFCNLAQIPADFPDAHRQSQQTLQALSEKVAAFAGDDRVILVVVGDLLDLSLAFVRESLLDLIGLLKRLPSVDEMVYVIGNHDHHIWSMHSEWERSGKRLQQGDLPLTGGMYRKTPRTGERHEMLSGLCTKQVGRPIQITVAYPTYSFEHQVAGENTLFYFTHGHLFGGLYTALSDILDDKLKEKQLDVEEVAATVNASLIEFIYWSLSQTGDGMGADGFMEQVYTDLQLGNESNVRGLIQNAVDLFMPEGVITGIPDRLEQWLVVAAAMHVIKDKSHRDTGSKSTDRHNNVNKTRAALQRWIQRVGLQPALPTHFVYGHTHVADRWQVPETKILSYNLGSWLVEPPHPTPHMQLLFVNAGDDRLSVDFESL